MSHDDDLLSSRLRDALRAEAENVSPRGDGLARIRAGLEPQPGPVWWRGRTAAIALAAAAVVGIAVGGVATLGGGDDHRNQVAVQPTPTTPAVSPTPSPSVTSSATTSHDYRLVPVYYVHSDGAIGPRLYREFADLTSVGPVGQAAVEQLLHGSAVDPDYSSMWSGTQLESYATAAGVATMRLSGTGPTKDMDIALQELVYTLTAADKGQVQKVTVVLNGSALAGTDRQPLARAPMLEVQGLVWVLGPHQGQTVGSPVTLDFFGTGFEGQFEYDIRQGGTVIKHDTVRGGTQGAFSEHKVTVTLPPGRYEVRGYDSGGSGVPAHFDTKTFTVR